MDGKDKEIERLRRENAELKKCVEERDIIIEGKSKKIETLESQLDESQRKLRVYENPNTPPLNRDLKRSRKRNPQTKNEALPKDITAQPANIKTLMKQFK